MNVDEMFGCGTQKFWGQQLAETDVNLLSGVFAVGRYFCRQEMSQESPKDEIAN